MLVVELMFLHNSVLKLSGSWSLITVVPAPSRPQDFAEALVREEVMRQYQETMPALGELCVACTTYICVCCQLLVCTTVWAD